MSKKETCDCNKPKPKPSKEDTFTANQKILKARISLLKPDKHPYLSPVSYALTHRPDDTIPTMAVSLKKDFMYNVDFTMKLTQPETVAVTLHEYLHMLQLHPHRGYQLGHNNPKFSYTLFNFAADAIVNLGVLKCGYTLPKDCGIKVNVDEDTADCSGALGNHLMTLLGMEQDDLIIKDISKKTPEEIYAELYRAFENSKPDFDKILKEMIGDGHHWTDLPIPDFHRLKEEALKRAQDCKSAAKGYGKGSDGLGFILDSIDQPTVNWKQELREFFTRKSYDDYSYRTPSRASRALGVYLPSLHTETCSIIVGIDTSGSTIQDIPSFFAEIFGIIQQFPNIELSYICWDDAVYGTPKQITTSTQIKDINLQGQGGTDVNHFLRWQNNKDVQMKYDFDSSIILTDGYFPDPDESLVLPNTLWCLSRNSVPINTFNKKLGRVCKII